MSPEEDFQLPTDEEILEAARSGEKKLFEESIDFVPYFLDGWNQYQRLLNSAVSLFRRSLDSGFSEEKKAVESYIIDKFKTDLENIGLSVIKAEDDNTLTIIVDNHFKFKEWIDGVKKIGHISEKNTHSIASICEILLRQLYKKDIFKEINLFVGFLSVVGDMCDLADYVTKHSTSAFFEQDYNSLKYLKEAVSRRYLREYITAVQAGIIDTEHDPANNFPWIKMSVVEFAEKSKKFKTALEHLIEIYKKKSSAEPVCIFINDLLVDWDKRIESYLKPDNGKVTSVNRETFFVQIQMLLETVVFDDR